MNISSRTWICMVCMLLFSAVVVAGPVYPKTSSLQQPDGTVIPIRVMGDEWNNWVETEDGYTIRRGDDGWWYLLSDSDHAPADLVAGHADPAVLGIDRHLRTGERPVPLHARSGQFLTPEHLAFAKAAKAPIEHKILVLLVDFDDQSAVGTTASDWHDAMFSSTARSVRDYYLEVSRGQVDMSPADETDGTVNDGIVGWLRMGAYGESLEYSGHPDTRDDTGDQNRSLTKAAILAADEFVDFSQFDSNFDGYVSVSELSIIVIVGGYETSYGYPSNLNPSVWGHRWSLWGGVGAPTVDDVVVGQAGVGGYIQYGEWHETTDNGHMATIGIMCHELGHDAFGLPDLYDTDGGSAGIGGFGLMSGGCWGRAPGDSYGGMTPVHLCAWNKIISGFLSPVVATVGAQTLAAAASSDDVVKIETDDPNQYFLVENRYQTGYDAGLRRYIGLAGGGLAIWHVDESVGNNRNPEHKLVDLEEAEDACEMDCDLNDGDADDLYHAANGFNTTFTHATTPGSGLYDGTGTSIRITGISARGASMTFQLETDPFLDHVTITGSTSVNETEQLQLNCVASYSDGAAVGVTGDCSWSVSAGPASIDGQGLLTAGSVDTDTPVIVTAQYADEGDLFEDTHTVTIRNVPDPDPVSALNASAAVSGEGYDVTLSWDAVPTADSYEIQRSKDGTWQTPVLTDDWAASPYLDADILQTGTYVYRIRSRAVNGTTSTWTESNALQLVVGGGSTFTITASAGSGGGISPAGSIVVSEGEDQAFSMVPDSGYQVLDVTVDGLSVGAQTAYTFENVMADHTIHATFRTEADTIPPTAPTNLYARQAGNGNLELCFSPSTDPGGSGVRRYHVFRSDSPSKSKSEIGSTTATSYADTDVSLGQTVFYSLVAEDNAGNLSAQSETIGLVIPGADAGAPGAPVGLTATLNGGESLSVSLAWKLAADDGSGVSVFEIFRQAGAPGEPDTPYAVSRDTRFADTDITNGQQVTYWVRSRDLSGNVSVPVSVSVTTPLSGLEPADYFAYFPHLATGANWWTGFALSNTSGFPANIEIQFFGSDGTHLTTLADPVTLAAGEKILTTIAALFDNNVPEGASWWRVLSDQPLSGFELFGRPSNDQTTEEMVGVKIARGASERLLFPIVTVSETSWTGIALVNTSSSGTAVVTFTAYDADGATLAVSDPVSVPAFGKTVKLAESYFGDELPAGTATLIMSASRPCIGFELFGYKDHTGLAGVSAVVLPVPESEIPVPVTEKSAADQPYRYRVSRTITAAGQQVRYQLTNTEDTATDLDVVTTYAGSQESAAYSIPAMGSLELAVEPDVVHGLPVSTELSATGPLTLTETFEDRTAGYFDSLFGMHDGSGTNPVTHVATSTGYWDTVLYLWNPVPYYNRVTMTVIGADGQMLDLTASGLSNPFVLTLDPGGSWEGEIHDLISSDGDVTQIGWIQVKSQFSLNGYFTFGTKDGRKVSAIELE